MGAKQSALSGSEKEAAAIAAFRAPRVCAHHDSAYKACVSTASGGEGAIQCLRLKDMADVCRARVAGGAAREAADAWQRCAASAVAGRDGKAAREAGRCDKEAAKVRDALKRLGVPRLGEAKVPIPR